MSGQSIVIVGLKHCGKSSVGRLLAERLQRPYYDADGLLEQHYWARHRRYFGVREIYDQLGKEGFDQIQVQVLEEFFAHYDLDVPPILSLGGGAGDLDEIGRLLETCLVVLLEEELALLFQRIASGGLPPFLRAARNSEAAFAQFCELSAPRLQRYRAWADLILCCAQRKQPDLVAELQNMLKD